MTKITLPENDPALRSFIDMDTESDFPIQNLPYGVFSLKKDPALHVGVAIGEHILDLAALQRAGFLRDIGLPDGVFETNTLNAFMALGQFTWRKTRARISALLNTTNPELRDNHPVREKVFFKQSDAVMHLPIQVRGYTDFYSSKEHASNLGAMFRSADNPLLPNWSHIPIGYDGRASSIVVSGTDFHRPNGQIKPNDAEPPIFSSTQRLCTELEVGFIVGQGSQFGDIIRVTDAPQHLFGVVLLSDWSARDIQKWEYVPLGPFLGKNFCTTVSPWIVTLDALQAFRVKGPLQDPTPLPYLQCDEDWGLDLHLEMHLKTQTMDQFDCISKTNFKSVYWNCCQQLAHHTINGCPMNTGDLFASGTVSGSEPGTYGSILELSWGGKTPIKLSNGEERVFLKDYDSVALRAHAKGQGYRIGFGEALGTVLPAKNFSFE